MLRNIALRCDAFRPNFRPLTRCRIADTHFFDKTQQTQKYTLNESTGHRKTLLLAHLTQARLVRKSHAKPQFNLRKPLTNFFERRFAEVTNLEEIIVCLHDEIANSVDSNRFQTVSGSNRKIQLCLTL